MTQNKGFSGTFPQGDGKPLGNQNAQRTDLEVLKKTFRGTLDESKIRSWLKELGASSEKLKTQTYAMGSVFRCLRLRCPLSKMDLAVKLPLSFSNPTEKLSIEKRFQLIRHLSAITEPTLIPPFQVLVVEKQPILIMPFANQEKTQAELHWRPLDAWISHTHKVLASYGLQFCDIDQIKCWNGIPMMIDLSDLKRI